ncbi:hypothetical protein [Methanosarcina mazei]|jgi:hypothetical protein|uniref:Uncharacterized protein n=1 Tax=Methanosarcina mazei TaxID=2209 RepID=A0A0F8H335_METMZ|nr:hypothetical protein [Methanosarcina mazei]KKG71006.1 hypothetical protein DU63_05875 [Methanosarcina mazei]
MHKIEVAEGSRLPQGERLTNSSSISNNISFSQPLLDCSGNACYELDTGPEEPKLEEYVLFFTD